MPHLLIHCIKWVAINRVVNQLEVPHCHMLGEAIKHLPSAGTAGHKGSLSIWLIIVTVPTDSVGDNVVVVHKTDVIIRISIEFVARIPCHE